jgi:DNA-directed RNA polymerase specialized sigma24 family protein
MRVLMLAGDWRLATGDRYLAEDLVQDVLVYGRCSPIAGMEQVDAYVRRVLVAAGEQR